MSEVTALEVWQAFTREALGHRGPWNEVPLCAATIQERIYFSAAIPEGCPCHLILACGPAYGKRGKQG